MWPLRRGCDEGGADVIGDVLALVGAIEQHRLQDIDRLRVDVVQLVNDRALVTGWVRIGDEGEHFVGELVGVDLEAKEG